jgi:hypothetical protein
VVIVVLAIMSAMLNQYIVIDAARQVQSWLHDPGSHSGLASTAAATTAAAQAAAKEGGHLTPTARSPEASSTRDEHQQETGERNREITRQEHRNEWLTTSEGLSLRW